MALHADWYHANFFRVFLCCICFWGYLYCFSTEKESPDTIPEYEFSGVYTPAVKKFNVAEDFAASWLITRERFLVSKSFIEDSTNMAGVSFAITRTKCRGCFVSMSRDYMDFLVEHLSSTSNSIPYSNKNVFAVYEQRIRQTVSSLRNISEHSQQILNRASSDPRLTQTLGILVYSSITFSRPQAILHCQIRKYFFAATFWSVHRYIPHIIIFVASDQDRQEVEAMDLPAVEIKQFVVPLDNKNRTVALPRFSLSWINSQLHNNPPPGAFRDAVAESHADPQAGVEAFGVGGNSWNYGTTTTTAAGAATNTGTGTGAGANTGSTITTTTAATGRVPFSWSKVKYVYFTEGDQILHMRSATELYNALDNGRGRLALVPHRMQTLPLANTMEKDQLRRAFKSHMYLYPPNAQLVTLDLANNQASCCDNGRYTIANCKRWWYQCRDWGLRDMNPWLQFGHTGYTTVSASTHKGACTYSPARRVCPMPANCQYRIPPRHGNYLHKIGPQICSEMPIVTHLGPAETPS